MANNFEITNRGNKLLDTAQTWVANEGLDPEDALSETAMTIDDLGAIVTALVSDGYLDEETIFQAAVKGLVNLMDEEYGVNRW